MYKISIVVGISLFALGWFYDLNYVKVYAAMMIALPGYSELIRVVKAKA